MSDDKHSVCTAIGHWVHGVEQVGPRCVRWRCRVCGAESVSDAKTYDSLRSRQRNVVTLVMLICVFSALYLLEVTLIGLTR